ncbi:MAG: nitroreductase [Chitinophagaceae bacterium]
MLEEIIRKRRSVKPAQMTGKQIDDAVIKKLLELANWAPTHGRTEPWRFIVYPQSKIPEFARANAEIYRETTPADKYKEPVYHKLQTVEHASHLVIAYMKRGSNANIPEIEEISATAAAVQNLLLAAASEGISTFWSTSGRTHHPAMKEYFGLAEEDIILGQIYLGYSDTALGEGSRTTSAEEKIRWIN